MKTPSGTVNAKAVLLMCSADLPAKALLVDMKQFNGKQACSHCLDEGVTRETSHLHRNWPFNEHVTLRTHQTVIRDARNAVENGTVVSIPCFSIIVLFY